MPNRIIVDLIARDFITPAIKGIQKAAAALRNPVNLPRASAPSMAGYGSGINPFTQGLATAVAFKGLDVAIQGFQKLTSAIQDTAKAQTKLIGDAGGFSALSGLSYDASASFFKKLNIDLSKTAALLPGSAKDYTDAANSIATALVSAYNVKTPDGLKRFQADLQKTTENIVVLSQQNGVLGDGGTEFAKRFISGTSSFNELRLLDFGTKNPAFLKFAKSEMAKMGVDVENFQKLTEKQRADVLNKVSARLVTPEMKARMMNTADAMMAGIQDNLVNPYIGTFGLLREVSSQGGRSVMDSFTDMLRISMRLGGRITDLARASGLLLDPMEMVISAIDYAADSMMTIERSIAGAKKINFYDAFSGIGQTLFKLALDGMTAVNWSLIGQAIGAGSVIIAKYFIDPKTWISLLKVVAMALKGAFELFTGILTGFVGELARSSIGWVTGVGQSIKDFFVGIINRIKAPIDAVGNAFISTTDNIRNGLASIPGNPLGLKKDEAPSKPDSAKPNFFGIQLPQFSLPSMPSLTLPSLQAPSNNSTFSPTSNLTNNVTNTSMAMPVTPLAASNTINSTKTANASTANTFNINITAPEQADSKTLAQLVIDTITQQYTAYRSNALTA